MHEDVREDCEKRGHVDLYVSGFPCQPFSTIGRGAGGTGPCNSADAVLDYTTDAKPTVFVLENATGLVARHTPVFSKVLQRFQTASDKVTRNIVWADDHGIPQSRSRVYIIGIQAVATGRRFEWPAPLKVKPGLKHFLDDAPEDDDEAAVPAAPLAPASSVSARGFVSRTGTIGALRPPPPPWKSSSWLLRA